ncbi:MAG: EAL domain-containing protein [Kangiellaceae bacterium]|nr:EAL domain-containing protein [Kangiellaceae bacterium]
MKLLFDTSSLRFKLTSVFILLVMLPALALMATNAIVSLNSGLERAYIQLETVTKLKEESLNRWVEHLESDLVSTLDAKELRWHISVLTEANDSVRLFTQVSFNRVKTALERTQSRGKRYTDIYLFNKDGLLILSTSSEHKVLKFKDSESFKTKSNEFSIQFPLDLAKKEKKQIHAIMPVINSNDQIIGFLVGVADSSQLTQLLGEKEGLGLTGESFLMSKNGILLSASNYVRHAIVPTENKVTLLKLNSEGSYRSRQRNYQDKMTLRVLYWLDSLKVVLVTEQQESEAFAPIYTALRVSVLVTIFALILAIALGIYFTKRLTAPMLELAHSASQVSKGILDTVIKVKGSTEFVNLAKIFNSMTLRLRELINQLENSEQQQRDLLNNTSSVIYIKDLQGHYVFVNHQYEELFNVKDSNISKKSDFEIFPDRIAKEFRQNDKRVLKSNSILEFEETVPLADGEHTYLSVKFPLKNSKNETYGVCGISTDITYLKKQEEVILHQAHFDALTDLPNRFLSLDRLNQMLRSKKRTQTPLALLFLDLDDFKKINDSLGHEVGDQLLVQVANRLSHSLRETDTVGRLGGDEFVIILGEIADGTDARPVAENLLSEMRTPFHLAEHELILTVTIGIAVFPDDGETPAELVKSADTAMYSAKADGGNAHCYFTTKMKEDVSRQLLLEQMLHNALANRELSLCYQPIVAIKSERIVGFEALIRWQNTELGFVSPDEFIPIAERTGLIVNIGEWVLNEALSTLAKLRDKFGEHYKMAVNLSPREFRNPRFIQQVKNAIAKAGVPYGALDLEITEGVLMGETNDISRTLLSLDKMGVGIAMDDFGTGYSSLSYLRKYPFTVLKIDQSFVFDIETDPQAKEIVNVVIAMAHILKLKVVGEGVETREQLNYLEKHHCDSAQGYYFSKPLPYEDVLRLLDSESCTK